MRSHIEDLQLGVFFVALTIILFKIAVLFLMILLLKSTVETVSYRN